MKVKVLYFLINEARAGVEEHVLSLIKGLDKSLFETHLVCPPALISAMDKDLKGTGCKIFPLYLWSWLQWREVQKFMEYIKKVRPHIVHSHCFRASFILMPLARYIGVPITIETAHGTDVWRKGFIRSSHAFDRMLSRLTTRFVAVSHAVKRYFVRVKGISEDKIVVIHNGRDLGRFRPYEPSRIERLKQTMGLGNGSASGGIVTVIGRLHEQKGHCYFIESLPHVLREHPQIQVLIVGDGLLRANLKQQAKDLNITNNITFTGYKSNIHDWIAVSDIVVLPSLWEGLPLVLIEASAMGRAIVATDVDGSPEVVIHEETGLIVPPRNPGEIGRAINRLLADRHLREEVGRRGSRFVAETFHVQTQIEKTQALYEDLLKQNPINYTSELKVANSC